MTVSIAQAQLFFLAFTRIMAMLIQVPVLGGRLIPNQVKIGLGVMLTAVILPWQPLPPAAPSLPLLTLGLSIGRELLVGTVAGFAAVLTFGALQMAGELMGLGGGFGAGRVLNPAFESSGSALDQLFLMTALLLFLALNGHHLFLVGVQKTFALVPLDGALASLLAGGALQMAGRVLTLAAQLIAAGVVLALPVTGAALLADITLGLLARVAPQVQVFFLGAPLKVGLSLITLTTALAILLPTVADLLRAVGPRMLVLLGG